MILERGDMWSVFDSDETDVFMITTNPIVKKDGSVVMGRGIALEAKTRFPRLPYAFGTALQQEGNRNVAYIDHFGDNGTPVWYFMVKNHWRDSADLAIINRSIQTIWDEYNGFKGVRVDLNFPGIGNGRLKREDVLPLLEELPDNFHIWEKDETAERESKGPDVPTEGT